MLWSNVVHVTRLLAGFLRSPECNANEVPTYDVQVDGGLGSADSIAHGSHTAQLLSIVVRIQAERVAVPHHGVVIVLQANRVANYRLARLYVKCIQGSDVPIANEDVDRRLRASSPGAALECAVSIGVILQRRCGSRDKANNKRFQNGCIT